MLGRLNPDYFPKIFGSQQDQPLDREASEKALDELTDEINTWGKSHGQKTKSREEVALGFLKVANEVMIRPIREISVMRGFDIKEHGLSLFWRRCSTACMLPSEGTWNRNDLHPSLCRHPFRLRYGARRYCQ
mgnify:CR=1 FL=1